ncbi:MAG: phosphoribosylanthranilate isomerase [Alphaproteobacteria bacterium]|nr:phosphoribosylanthranilate isomerase [Alphaproteobacteria bacterium]
MPSSVEVKICGISTPEARDAAVDAGASMLGFVFFPRSPRNVSLEHARDLAAGMPVSVGRVPLLVNASDNMIGQVVDAIDPTLLQLHGSETPERCAQIQSTFGIHVMKAVGIASGGDVLRAKQFADVCDRLLLDAKPRPGADRPGGNAERFDWSLVADLDLGIPWLLAGGLTPDNVAEAIRVTGCPGVDVSSGVESAPGVKDPELIRRFVAAARA